MHIKKVVIKGFKSYNTLAIDEEFIEGCNIIGMYPQKTSIHLVDN